MKKEEAELDKMEVGASGEKDVFLCFNTNRLSLCGMSGQRFFDNRILSIVGNSSKIVDT